MTLIVGLGNPGASYLHSRHNIGFHVVEQLEKKLGMGQWTLDKTANAQICQTEQAVLVKPQTYMNLSGNAVRAVLKKFAYAALAKRDFHTLFVIYDDLDIEIGKYKLIFGTGPKVHNGVNHIKEVLGSDQFWHIRIGTDGRGGDRSEDPQDYVLHGFSDEEQVLVDKVCEAIVDTLAGKITST